MIQIEHVTKNFGNFKLSDINLSLPAGYICGLIGENGAGKTSLIHLLLGLYRPDDGQIFINGNDINRDEVAAKNEIGYVLSEELFDGELTLLQNASLYGKYYKNYDRDTFLSYCKRFELDEKKKLKQQSKGQKLKFQFAFALSHAPKVLILDEPTANFDPTFRSDFIKILTEFIQDGTKSVLLATHLTSDLDRIGDYITFLHKGKIIFSSDRQEMEDSFRLVRGEDYKINLIPKERIIHKEKTEFGSKALVHHRPRYVYDNALSVDIPTIEDIMYYFVKGDSHV
ncbi:MAG: ABC transporter ATP-binding protein [Lachnospiraceae bacterium]|nr:ABC transporter ATP-binding protein [Lachnospiraceae bacterium]